MLSRFSKINTMLLLVICKILIVFLSMDILYSVKSSRDVAIREVERWSVLLAETVRVSLNTLMKDEKMDSRFGMFESMVTEIPGLEEVRVIRGEKVNELFMAERNKMAIPRQQQVITDARKKVKELSAKLSKAKESYERKDLESEIADAQGDIASAEKNIRGLQRPMETDPRELPSAPEDRKVLDSGKPLYIVDGDKLLVWAPYVARKSCGAAGGCHAGVEVGNVLGAVQMQFSLAGVNKEINKNAVISTASKIMLSLLIIGSLMFMITRIITRPLQLAVTAANTVARGDLAQRIEVTSKDETGQLMQALKVMNESLIASRAETERMIKEIAAIVEGASLGDFSARMDIADKTGLFRQLGEGINKLVQTSEAGLGEVARVLSALSHGDLTEKITTDYSGAFGQLKDDANNTVEQLKQIVLQIKESTDTITAAAQQIYQGNTDLSQRTEEQASNLEETASSMEELTSTVKQNTESAKQANQLSVNASDIAVKGGHVVDEVVNTMASISASSKKIVEIISVIEGIAFQTNILALNAAVEAARAGDQGRGFAVVASEVRNLAQRSAAAAKEIKTMIGDSVDKVEIGSRQVNRAGETMEEIVQAVKRVTDIMSEIAAASSEQSAGIEQVNQAITQMDAVTQQNAALVEEAANATEAMQEQAKILVEAVSIFKLGDDRTSARSAAARPAIPHPAPSAQARITRKPARAKEGKAREGKTREGKTREDNDGDWKVF